MKLDDIIWAEFRFVYADVFRRKAVLVMFIMYPYMLTALVLLIGYGLGSPSVFVEKVGIDPSVFFITAGFILMAIIGVGDDIMWRPMFDEWMGTLPYIISSPVPRVQHYIAIPLPRLVLVLISGATSVVPVLTFYYGLNGFLEGLVILGLTGLGAVFYSIAVLIIVGLIYSSGGENWRVINILRPLLMILLGAYYPRFLMPLAGRIASSLIPSSHVVEAIQRILASYGSPVDIFLLLGVATALFIIYTPLGLRSIVYWEKTKVREGVKVG